MARVIIHKEEEVAAATGGGDGSRTPQIKMNEVKWTRGSRWLGLVGRADRLALDARETGRSDRGRKGRERGGKTKEEATSDHGLKLREAGVAKSMVVKDSRMGNGATGTGGGRG